MDPVTLILVIKTVIAVLLIAGGLAAMYFGVGLYRNGVGLKSDGSTVETKDAKFQLKTVGSVLMLTSVGWGGLAYLSSPKLTQKPGEVTVAIAVPPVVKEVAATDLGSIPPQQLERWFQESRPPVTVDGADASLVGVRSFEAEDGQTGLITEWESPNSEKLELTFTPSLDGDTLRYMATKAELEGYEPAAGASAQ